MVHSFWLFYGILYTVLENCVFPTYKSIRGPNSVSAAHSSIILLRRILSYRTNIIAAVVVYGFICSVLSYRHDSADLRIFYPFNLSGKPNNFHYITRKTRSCFYSEYVNRKDCRHNSSLSLSRSPIRIIIIIFYRICSSQTHYSETVQHWLGWCRNWIIFIRDEFEFLKKIPSVFLESSYFSFRVVRRQLL